MSDFEGQRDDEVVLFVFRRSLVSVKRSFLIFLLISLISIMPIFVWRPEGFVLYLALGGSLIGLFILVYNLIRWYFSIYIVTNHRIRQVSQRGIFSFDVVEFDLEDIQNISYKVPGFFAGVLRFGTLIIQAEPGDMVIYRANNPSWVYNKLQDVIRDNAKNKLGDV